MTDYSPNSALADDLNQHCACSAVDPLALKQTLAQTPELASWVATRTDTHPHLFASTMVFISKEQRLAMQSVVSAVHGLSQSQAWLSKTLAYAPSIASVVTPKSQGVFLGFDFHLQTDGAQLIEINTNAGGALLNAALAKAQKSCCALADPLFEAVSVPAERFDETVIKMFRTEWVLQRGDAPLRTIAIVDERPSQQFLAPEFSLFQQLFERSGIRAVIADPSELVWRAGQLWFGDQVVDLVYNRLTDFYLDTSKNVAILEAYKADAVVFTPHPRAHAIFASKRNLTWLSSEAALIELGVPANNRAALLTSVPQTIMLTTGNAEELWAQRKHYFFKPLNGFGSRAAYRGDKLTQRVWSEILQNDYVAQMLVMPSQRLISDGDELKVDIRAYAYEGEIQLFAARLYQGQTTNMRTPSGGFAPVFSLPD
ncbi:MAG: hypothetical protein QM533_13550 [Cytophagales bacterium]|nr:hypothetical protein [Cytophagales bacterium]